MKEKTLLLIYFMCFQMHSKRLQLKYFIVWLRNNLFLTNYVTSEGAVSHNVEQLSIALPRKLLYFDYTNSVQ